MINFRIMIKKQSKCPYFSKVTFKKIEMLSQQPSIEECNILEQQIKTDIQLKIPHVFLSREDSIPSEGKTNLIKIENYRAGNSFANKVASIQSMKDKENISTDIIQIKMPKMFMSSSLGEKVNTKYKKNQKDKTNLQHFQNVRRQKKQSSVSPHEIDEANLQLSDEQLENNLEGKLKHLQTKINQLSSTYSSFVKLISSKCSPKQKYCFLFLDQKILRISSKHIKYENIDHIEFFVTLLKYQLQFCQQKDDSKKLQVKIIGKGTEQKFIIEFQNQGQKYVFKSVYQQNRNKQKNKENKKLKYGEQASQIGNQFRLNNQSLSSIDSFHFRVERACIETFESNIQSFDIILFKGKTIMSKMQRFFTNSNFDHVGLLMKTYDQEILLLESTGNAGVAIYTFNSIKRALSKQYYDRIAIRKLIYQKQRKIQECKNHAIKKLQKFVSEVNGKQYRFDPMYLLWPYNKTKKVQANCNIEERNRKQKIARQDQQTYFCSELVAEALKYCGIMKQNIDKPSCGYLPKHFSDIDGLNDDLAEGFSYSEFIVLQ